MNTTLCKIEDTLIYDNDNKPFIYIDSMPVNILKTNTADDDSFKKYLCSIDSLYWGEATMFGRGTKEINLSSISDDDWLELKNKIKSLRFNLSFLKLK